MLCRVCLKDATDFIQIFDKSGIELNISNILSKYFWFEPKQDDPLSKSICMVCWYKISNFHKFYEEVEEAHRLLTERFSMKQDKGKKNIGPKQLCYTPETCDISSAISTRNEEEGLTTNSLDINRILSESVAKVTLGDKSFTLFANHEDNVCQEDTDIYVNDEEESFNGESFMEKILNEDDYPQERKVAIIKVEDEDVCSQKRITRSTNSKSSSKNHDPVKEEYSKKECHQKKRRGRPCKIGKIITSSNTSIKTVIPNTILNNENIPIANTEEKKVPQIKLDDVDEKIAKHVKLSCDICDKLCDTFADLKCHMQDSHCCRGYLICCGRKFYKRTLLNDHVEKHINPERFKCNQCDKVFADKQCVRNHMWLKHQPEEKKIFQCEHCEKRFAKAYLLEQHRVMHDERIHICDICRKGFPSKNSLKSHMKLTHGNYGGMCNICAKVIRSRTLFQKHMLEHEGIIMPKVQCEKCGSWHKDKYSLQKHKRRHNEEGTVYKCDTCGKIAPNRSALLSHIRYVHASERIYNCQICDKSFKRSINLKEHMATHTGDVLYKCLHCPSTFNSNANMHSHRKKVHPIEFEETRKNRLAAKAESTNFIPIQRIAQDSAKKITQSEQPAKVDVSLESAKHNQQKMDAKSTKIECNNLTKILTIKSADGGETHQVIVTTEQFVSDDDVDDGNNIVFTIT